MVVRRVTVAWPVPWAVNAAYTLFHTEPRGRFFWPVWCALEVTAVQASSGSRRTRVARKLLEGSRRGQPEWFEFPAKTRGVTDRHTHTRTHRRGFVAHRTGTEVPEYPIIRLSNPIIRPSNPTSKSISKRTLG